MTQTVNHSQKREDVNLYQLYQALLTEPDVPSMDTYAPLGEWLDIAMEMRTARMKAGIAGVKAYIRAFNNLKQKSDQETRLIQLLSGAPPNEAEAEEDLDPRLTREKKGERIFRTLSETDILNLPDSEYLISGLLQVQTVSLLFGESNTGKTFNGLHIAECVARGRYWLGRPVKQGVVLYIYAEGRLGMKLRLQAWHRHFDAEPTEMIRFLPFPVHLLQERDILLATIASQEHVPNLLVVDPYSMCATGTDQNNQMEVTRTLEIAHEITRLYGCHVLVIHHANRQGLFNGTAAFKNHVDTMMELTKEDKTRRDSAILLHCEKQRDGAYFDDIKLALHRVELGLHPQTLEMRSSCVVVASETTSREIDDEQQEREKMLNVLRIHKTLSTNKWKAISTKELGVSHRGFYAHIDYFKAQSCVRWTEQGNGKGIMFSPLSEGEEGS
jgi:RecA-family ATPase